MLSSLSRSRGYEAVQGTTHAKHSPNLKVLKGEDGSANDIRHEIQQLLRDNWNLPGVADVLRKKHAALIRGLHDQSVT